MHCNADIVLHIHLNAKHLSMFVENKYLVKFDDRDFLTLINHFITNPLIGKFTLSTFRPEVPHC